MKSVGIRLSILFLSVACASHIMAQELGELEVQPVPEDQRVTYIVRGQDEAILVVHSTLPHLSFENNMGIIRVDNPDPGEFRLHLPPGTNIVTFKAEGYLPAKQRYHIQAKDYQEVHVSAKEKLRAARVENRPEIILRYTPGSPDERLLGSIDDNVMHLDFSGGVVKLRPAPGKHAIKLNSEGRIWEKSFDLKEGEKVEEKIVFPEEPSETVAAVDPGGLYITSNPSGATIYMNRVEQGLTPLTLQKVQPGRYEFNIERPLYLPESFIVEVKPLDYSTHHVDLTPNFGNLRIETDPPGATVYLNSEERGLTPLELPQVETGNYSLRLVRSKYYEVSDILEIAAGDTIMHCVNLKPKFGSFTITSDPPGADVSIDGQVIGRTPVEEDTILSGSHLIRLQLEHYNDLDDLIVMRDGEEFNQHYILHGNFGLLTVISDPSEADVLIEGIENKQARSPINEMKLAPGSYHIRVEKEGYEPSTTSIMLALGAEELLEPKLVRMTGILKVSSKPQGATIFLNNEDYGKTPQILKEVPTGEYEIRIDKSGYDLVIDQVSIENRQISTFDAALSTVGTEAWLKVRHKARLLSLFAPGGGQFVSGQNWRGGLYASAMLTLIYLVFDSHWDHEDYHSTYKDEVTAYNNAHDPLEINHHYKAMNDAHHEMVKAEDNWNLFLILTGTVYAVQLADAWMWGGGPRPQAKPIYSETRTTPRFFVDINERTVCIGMRVNFGVGE